MTPPFLTMFPFNHSFSSIACFTIFNHPFRTPPPNHLSFQFLAMSEADLSSSLSS
ncbi:uncharacterized protein LACBIDRAFT_314408 [Laccaria bicolor S238N-H82]|uniref:Predicted protein n=1 Tax=Laccaria bicolor (strain S238N-H82 / ATCC MYA-4686) TaxID=486041 RepID=B0DYH9_LACBS|nr:uncharacterized protein LACBIDRAFT_314408 [Laccaria bicolor S238N-H82]EDR00390.1 predicted protein [Laccaria bicolor S238N-H82]|eukprot:XP_001888949.1 predicted protein [Laccaria bicolor S238N-H82]